MKTKLLERKGKKNRDMDDESYLRSYLHKTQLINTCMSVYVCMKHQIAISSLPVNCTQST
jgi:hypothetical protein